MNKWYNSQGGNSDVVLYSKVRLARNLADAPFPCRMSSEIRKSVCKKIFAAIKNSSVAGDFDFTDMQSLGDIEKIALTEKGTISPEFAKQKQNGGLLVSKDESMSIMLCEEDHIRLIVYSAGQDIYRAYGDADKIDDILIGNLKIAFSEKLGFLTSNPMNLGTGLKASFIMHLPAIKAKGMMPSLVNMTGKLGFALRSVYGSSSDFYELSNRISLGITEKSALDNLNSICDQIVKQERSCRKDLIEYDDFEDKIFRAMGTLKMARRLTMKEFFSLISLVRLGISEGFFDEKYETIGELIHNAGSATIMSESDSTITVDDTDRIRAKYVRETLG